VSALVVLHASSFDWENKTSFELLVHKGSYVNVSVYDLKKSTFLFVHKPCSISTGDTNGITDITCRIWIAVIKKEEDG
jgi:hypothetical protein